LFLFYLSDAGESNKERNEANNGDENLFATAQQARPLIHHRRYEALQSAKLPNNFKSQYFISVSSRQKQP
jgi:hypothetical protein